MSSLPPPGPGSSSDGLKGGSQSAQQPIQPPASPFGDQGLANPFGDRPLSQNPYAPGAMLPQPGLDPTLEYVIPINTSGWAITAGYLGLLSLGICFLGPFAIFTGVMAWKQIGKNPQLHGKVRAVLGIALGTIGTLGTVAIILALAFSE